MGKPPGHTRRSSCIQAPTAAPPAPTPIIYRHGKRNVQLHFGGILPIRCPTADDSHFSGLAVFAGSLEEANAIMDAAPPSKPRAHLRDPSGAQFLTDDEAAAYGRYTGAPS